MTTSVAHVAPPVGQFLPDPGSVIITQIACDQGPAVSSEFNLMEMTEVEYSHLHHMFQSHIDVQSAEQQEALVEINPCRTGRLNPPTYTECHLTNHAACSPPSTPAVCQPDTSSPSYPDEPPTFSGSDHPRAEDVQEIKMILCRDPGSIVNEGEKTPTSCVEVPNSVLAKVKYASDRSVEPSDRRAPLQLRPNPPARVCLEKRFNCNPCGQTRQQDTQAAVLNTFLSMLHQPTTDTQSITLLAQSENRPKADKAAEGECHNPYRRTFLNNHVQGLNHLLEGSKHPEVILPKNFTLSYRPDKTTDILLRAPYIIHADQANEQKGIKLESRCEAENKSAPPGKRSRGHGPRPLQPQAPSVVHGPGNWKEGCVVLGCKRGKRRCPPVELKQRRERHNSKERDRRKPAARAELNIEHSLFGRKRIRLCCDELNLLVPFCTAETDKATTLQWTTAFLKYIREVHGNSLRQVQNVTLSYPILLIHKMNPAVGFLFPCKLYLAGVQLETVGQPLMLNFHPKAHLNSKALRRTRKLKLC
ncbi:hypothetical protein NFI96_026184 [Prochilodus magdalenae]|nr:hypothetical protein NFI96_026184 [Prochilodus magdalenae]